MPTIVGTAACAACVDTTTAGCTYPLNTLFSASESLGAGSVSPSASGPTDRGTVLLLQLLRSNENVAATDVTMDGRDTQWTRPGSL